MIGITTSGSNRMSNSLKRLLGKSAFSDLDRYGQMGVDALARATPVDSSLTANSWSYRVSRDSHGPRIEWINTNVVDGTPVAILIQYGHGTGTGGYVQGRDYINPAIQPVFDRIADDVWKKVKA